jgi:hypothetical protein
VVAPPPPPPLPAHKDLAGALSSPWHGAGRVFGALIALDALMWLVAMTPAALLVNPVAFACEIGLCISVILAVWEGSPDAMTPWAENRGLRGMIWPIVRVFLMTVLTGALLAWCVIRAVGPDATDTPAATAGFVVASAVWLAVMPACIATAIVRGDWVEAVNPARWIRSVRSLGNDYMVLVGLLMALVLVGWGIHAVADRIPWVGFAIDSITDAYLTVVGCTMLGRTFLAAKTRLEW